MKSFGKRSLDNLKGVHPDLIRVCNRALQICEVDFTVVEGLRSLARQKELYAQGRSAPGPIVTWTMSSKHLTQASGYGEAVDLVHISEGKALWEDYSEIVDAMRKAGVELEVPLRWGGDWDRDGKAHERGEIDNPHWELFHAG